MNAPAIVALVIAFLIVGVLVYLAARPRGRARHAEVYLYRPPTDANGREGAGRMGAATTASERTALRAVADDNYYQDYRHAYTDAVANELSIATPQQVADAARDGAYWHGLGFASDGALYALDGTGTPVRYDQHDTSLGSPRATQRRFGLLVFGNKPPITSDIARHIAPWNEQGQGHLPLWSQREQLYPNHYKNRSVNFSLQPAAASSLGLTDTEKSQT